MKALTKKIGPLPLWGWGVGLIGGYYVYTKYSASKAASDASGTDGSGNPASSSGPSVIQGPRGGVGRRGPRGRRGRRGKIETIGGNVGNAIGNTIATIFPSEGPIGGHHHKPNPIPLPGTRGRHGGPGK